MTILVTGGAGFIGSNFLLEWFAISDEKVINIDKLTYAGRNCKLDNIEPVKKYEFVHGSIGNAELVYYILSKYNPRAVINFAAESHVDRSINGPEDFIQTNILETQILLANVLKYWAGLDRSKQAKFRFLQVSTDEVYGSLEKNVPPVDETAPYTPNSPYSASKAAADHLVRAYNKTYGLPTITTCCSNNYGPRQFPEKLMPLTIAYALAGKAVPIYGDGKQIRDWLYVTDHCQALIKVLDGGEVGDTYNIGGSNEKSNLEIVTSIFKILDKIKPLENEGSYSTLISFVADRPGHDRRYAINAEKIKTKLNWQPSTNFDSNLLQTVSWYLKNEKWLEGAIKLN